MLDLIIRGGDVVTPHGVVHGDVVVAGEKIAAVGAVGALSAEPATRVIDATGHIVMPAVSTRAASRSVGLSYCSIRFVQK